MTPQDKAKKLLNHKRNPEMATYQEMAEISDSLKMVADTFGKMQIETIKGEKGDKGDSPSVDELKEIIIPLIPEPIKGDKGEDSIVPGPKGDKGDPGLDGYTPQKYKDYWDGVDGLNGIDGINGKDGKDGSPDTAAEIKEKLETLKGKERLDASAIKNLPDLIQTLSGSTGIKEIRAGDNITIDNSVLGYPIISATGGGGGGAVDSVNGQTGVVVLDTGDIDPVTNRNYVTDAQLVVIGNTSGINTGDQDLSPYFNKSVDDTDDITVGSTNKFATAAEKTKLGFITVTQAVDLDTLESDTVTNNAKVSNATHTGEVTGATALTIDKSAITGKSAVTAVGADYVLISDTSDSGNLKKALVSDLTGGSGLTLETDGVANGDQTLLNLISGTNITLTDDGVGGVTIDASGGTITGSDTRVLFFDGANNPAGDAGFTYNKTTDAITLAGSLGLQGSSPTTTAAITASRSAAGGFSNYILNGTLSQVNAGLSITTGLNFLLSHAAATGNTGFITGIQGTVSSATSGGAVNSLVGANLSAQVASGATGTSAKSGVFGVNNQGTLTTGVGLEVQVSTNTGATSTNMSGITVSMGTGGATTTIKGISLEAWFGAGTATTVYGIYANTTIDRGSTSWFIHSLATSSSYIQGSVSIGSSTVTAKLSALATTEQLRLQYDASNYFSTTIDSSGNATLNLTGTNPEFTFSDPVNVPDDAYDATSWNGNTEVPTKNAIRDKIESLGSGGTPGGADTQVQFNDGGVFSGDAGLTFNKTTDLLSVSGDISIGNDILLAEGGVINWDSGDITLTQTGNVLALAGGGQTITVANSGNVDGLVITQSDVTNNKAGLHIITPVNAANNYPLIIENTDSSFLGAFIQTYHNSASPAVNDYIGGWDMFGKNSIGDKTFYGFINVIATDVTDGTEDASFAFGLIEGGSGPTNTMTLSVDALYPSSNDGLALGTGTLKWSDLYLASGGVINFNNGNATVTHSVGLLTSNVPFSVGTSNAITAGTIELGNASDTTISRVSAGVIAVEGVTLMTNPMTTGGDLIYGGASGVPARLANGTAGQVLTSAGGTSAPAWGNGAYWDFAIKLGSDFVVTNSSTLTDVTGFSFAATAGDVWYIEIMGSTVANNTTGDIKADLITTGTWIDTSSYWQGRHYGGTGTFTNQVPTPLASTTTVMSSPTVNNGDGVVRSFYLQATVVVNGSGNIKFQIANVTAAAGRTSTLKAGSYMLARKLT